jgi:uncharacterized SAM-binding protein YcdF (DUF218 family)
MRRRRARRGSILLRVAGLALVTWLVSVLAVFLFGQRDEARRADVIVVLGAAQYDGRPSPVLRARLDHAHDLYRRGLAPTVITTGGVGVGDTVSEAVVGRRYLIRAGVPEGAVLTETAGLRSHESMAAAAALMQTGGHESALLVSDPFHMLRLRLMAWRMGLRAYASPTRSSPIERSSAGELRHIAREALVLPAVLLGRPGSAAAPEPERPEAP